MSTSTDDDSLLVFSSAPLCDLWLEAGADRGLGCPECFRVHHDTGDAFACCQADEAVPLIEVGGVRWHTAPHDVALDHLQHSAFGAV